MKNVVAGLCLFLVAAGQAIAQNGFYESALIIVGRDTIEGFIERTDEVQLSKFIRYKKETSSTTYKQYFPSEIDGFVFRKDSIWFQPVLVEIRKVNDVSYDLRFAKVLLKGYTDLFKLQLPDEDRVVFFLKENTFVYVVRKDSLFVTLGQYEFQHKQLVNVSKRYIDALKFRLFSDCPAVLSNVDQLSFEDKPIIRIVDKYNKCKNPDSQSVYYVHQIKPLIKQGIELTFATIPKGSATFDKASGFSFGYFVDIMRPDLNRKNSVRLGLNLLFLNYSLEGNKVSSKTYVRIPLAFQHILIKEPNAKATPFIHGGLTAVIGDSFTPFVQVGAGTFLGVFRLGAHIENEGFSLNAMKTVNISVGIRLDK